MTTKLAGDAGGGANFDRDRQRGERLADQRRTVIGAMGPVGRLVRHRRHLLPARARIISAPEELGADLIEAV